MINYYEVLEVNQACSTSEVKSAYIRLCKKFHPDCKHGDTAQHKKFLILNEAYTVLVNPRSRDAYDLSFRSFSFAQTNKYEHTYREDIHRTNVYSHTVYNKGQRNYEYGSGRKVLISKAWVLAGCFFLMGLGTVMNLMVYRTNFTQFRKKLDERDNRLGKVYSLVRKNAMSRTDEETISHLQQSYSEFEDVYSKRK